MNTDTPKTSRGRPKTLNRDHVLDFAMHAYWKEGIDGISLNEICKRCEISKPSLYREFGNEDGLMAAVHIAYQKKVFDPILKTINDEASFREVLDKLIEFAVAGYDDKNVPNGCLVVKMLESRSRVGQETQKQIDSTRQRVLTTYEDWVERSKQKGEFCADMSSQYAAVYIEAQLSYASSQIARGEKRSNLKNILITALSML